MKIDNGTGGSRETSRGKPEKLDEWGRESIFFAELKRRRDIVHVVGIGRGKATNVTSVQAARGSTTWTKEKR
jgi:hypothetical protein